MTDGPEDLKALERVLSPPTPDWDHLEPKARQSQTISHYRERFRPEHVPERRLPSVSQKTGGDPRVYLARTHAIPALRDDPKLVGRDDTKVVGDSVAKAVPFFGNSSPEEAQDCRSELREGFIASVIGDMFVHYAPASFDRIKMRTIGRDEVQTDHAYRLHQPLTHQNCVIVGGVI